MCTEGSVTVVRDADNSSLQLVEMCDSEGVWSPLCDSEWTIQDARVVCRETAQGLSKSVIDTKTFFDEENFLPDLDTYQIVGGSQQSFSAHVCTGNETDFTQCSRLSVSDTLCYHLLVQCSSTLSPPTLPPPTPPTPTRTTTTTTQTTTKGGQTDSTSEAGTDPTSPTAWANRPRNSSSSSQTNSIIAGVAVSLLVILALLGMVVVLGIFIYWRQKKYTTYNIEQQKKDE